MKFKSVVDSIGPIMIGPSSSHTAGAARIGRVTRSLFAREPKWANTSLALKETEEGGLAATPTGQALAAKIFGIPLQKK